MPLHTMLDIISTTALVPYQEEEGMYVYKHTYIHNYNGVVGYEFQCKKPMCTSSEQYCTG